MISGSRRKPMMPAVYAQIIIDMAIERGIAREVLLEGLDMPAGLFGGIGLRIPVEKHLNLARRAIELFGGEGNFNYEFGLRIALSAHGLLGFAAMSQLTIRSAIELAIRFSRLAFPVGSGRLFVEDQSAVVDLHLDPSYPADLHRAAGDIVLVCLWRAGVSLMNPGWNDIELWFDYPEPEYYARYRHRLPRCRFNMGAIQICFPAIRLDQKLATGDAITSRQLEEQCQRELELIGNSEDVVGQVRSLLNSEQGNYPDLESVCTRMFMSSRTLKRKLQQSGSSFQQLLDEAKCNEAISLLKNSTTPIEKIATRLGYSDPANFTHAFRKWTGVTPSAFRQQHDSGNLTK